MVMSTRSVLGTFVDVLPSEGERTLLEVKKKEDESLLASAAQDGARSALRALGVLVLGVDSLDRLNLSAHSDLYVKVSLTVRGCLIPVSSSQ